MPLARRQYEPVGLERVGGSLPWCATALAAELLLPTTGVHHPGHGPPQVSKTLLTVCLRLAGPRLPDSKATRRHSAGQHLSFN